MTPDLPKYKTSDEVDFVIIGSGAAGGILAKELSTNGFRVVVLEQGPYLTPADFTHDEVKVLTENLLTNILAGRWQWQASFPPHRAPRPTLTTDSTRSRSPLAHPGHSGAAPPITRASNDRAQRRQTYS